MASRLFPKSKPFQPPPASPFTGRSGNKVSASRPELAALPEQPRSKRGLYALLALVVVVLLAGGATLLTVALTPRQPSAASPDKSAEVALQHLADVQRSWFESENLGSEDNQDPAAAFSQLLIAQRQWWDGEGLAQDGNVDGNAALAKLEEMERSWWTREKLADGKMSSDAEGALKRLADIGRQWYAGEKIAKGPDAAGNDESGNGTPPPGMDNPGSLVPENAGTQKFLAAGGSEESEQAVQLGLQWLAKQQLTNGRWTANGSEGGQPRTRGGNDVASTALALLPFLAHGETHRGAEGRNKYSKTLEYGLKYLLSQMKANGDLRAGGNMYVHALASMALCQALDTTGDPLLREPSQKAIDFLVKAQDSRGGGFRYVPGSPGDMSVTSWCLMALKSGQMAGLHIPFATIDKAKIFLERMSRPDGGYNYVSGQPGHSPPTPAVMTAAGIVCRQYLNGRDPNEGGLHSSSMTRGIDVITRHPPEKKIHNYYYYYYATYALLPVGGAAWDEWNPKCRDLLVRLQDKGEKNPANRGSWDTQGAYQLQQAGRVGVTALALLTLEVYYRHLPVNRPELGEMSKDTAAPKK